MADDSHCLWLVLTVLRIRRKLLVRDLQEGRALSGIVNQQRHSDSVTGLVMLYSGQSQATNESARQSAFTVSQWSDARSSPSFLPDVCCVPPIREEHPHGTCAASTAQQHTLP